MEELYNRLYTATTREWRVVQGPHEQVCAGRNARCPRRSTRPARVAAAADPHPATLRPPRVTDTTKDMKKALAATYLPAAPTPVEVLQVS